MMFSSANNLLRVSQSSNRKFNSKQTSFNSYKPTFNTTKYTNFNQPIQSFKFCTATEANKPEKKFSPKIEDIVDRLSKLSVEEAAILNDVIYKVFNFRRLSSGEQAAAAAQAATPAGQTSGTPEAVQEVPKGDIKYNVKIKSISGGVKAKFAVMKLVQVIQPDLSLQDVCYFFP